MKQGLETWTARVHHNGLDKTILRQLDSLNVGPCRLFGASAAAAAAATAAAAAEAADDFFDFLVFTNSVSLEGSSSGKRGPGSATGASRAASRRCEFFCAGVEPAPNWRRITLE